MFSVAGALELFNTHRPPRFPWTHPPPGIWGHNVTLPILSSQRYCSTAPRSWGQLPSPDLCSGCVCVGGVTPSFVSSFSSSQNLFYNKQQRPETPRTLPREPASSPHPSVPSLYRHCQDPPPKPAPPRPCQGAPPTPQQGQGFGGKNLFPPFPLSVLPSTHSQLPRMKCKLPGTPCGLAPTYFFLVSQQHSAPPSTHTHTSVP